MKGNQEIESFISDILLSDDEKGEIVASLRELVLSLYPQSGEEIKYGGLVFIIDNRLYCGIFVRKDHVSLEFDNGSQMSDPKGLLQGSGKHRRHLKLAELEDIEGKQAGYYLRQSFVD